MHHLPTSLYFSFSRDVFITAPFSPLPPHSTTRQVYALALQSHSSNGGGDVRVSPFCQALCLSNDDVNFNENGNGGGSFLTTKKRTSPSFLEQHLGGACRLAALQLRWAVAVPPSRALVWTSDFHVSPIACDAPLLESADVMATVQCHNCVVHSFDCFN